jgi:hypothetical protein
MDMGRSNDQRVVKWNQRMPGVPMFSQVIPGTPVTKKNSPRIISVRGRKLIIPSKAYTQWLENCGNFVVAHHIDYPVSCCALIYRAKDIGDANNYYGAIADMLEHYQVVTNDRLIRHWDGSRILKDAKAPRVELILYTA